VKVRPISTSHTAPELADHNTLGWSEFVGGYNTSDTVTKHTGCQIRTMT